MKSLPLIAMAGALVLPSALSAAAFEGKVTLTLTNKREEPQTVTLFMREGALKVDMATERGQVTSVMDFKNHQTTIIMHEQRMYMVQPIRQDAQQHVQENVNKDFPPDVHVTTEKDTILGYDCTKIIATGKDGVSEIWITDQLGQFMGLAPGGAFLGGRRQVPPQWETILKGKDFFPLRVIVRNKDKQVSRMDVTSVEKMHFADSDFTAPEGYQKLDIGSMFRGAFPGGAPGQTPPPNPN